MSREYINIQKTNYGFIISENVKNIIYKKIFSIILLVFIGLVIFFVEFNFIVNPINIILKIIILLILLINIYYIIFIKEIIKIFNDKIIFILKIKLSKLNNIELKKINIKKISINYEINYTEGRGEIYIYNLDFIDNDFNAYRIAQSRNYNSIFNYGIELEKIINIKLSDNNDTEGYGNIYKKRIV